MRDPCGVPAVPRDGARRRQVQPRDQLRQRRLARAVLAHQRDHLPAAQGQRHPAQGVVLLAGIAEGHVGERDRLRAAVQGVQRRGPLPGGEVVEAGAVDVHVQAQLEQPVERVDAGDDRLRRGAHGQHRGPGQRQRQQAFVEEEPQPAVPDRRADPGQRPPDRRHAVLLQSHAHLVVAEVRGDPPVLAQNDVPCGERPQLGGVLALRQQIAGDEPAPEGGVDPHVRRHPQLRAADPRPALRERGEQHQRREHRVQQPCGHHGRARRDDRGRQVADERRPEPQVDQCLLGPLHQRGEVGVVERGQLDVGEAGVELVLSAFLDPRQEPGLDRPAGRLERPARHQRADHHGQRGQGVDDALRRRTCGQQVREDVDGGQQAERGGHRGRELQDEGQQRPAW